MMVVGLGVRTSGQRNTTRATVSIIEKFYQYGALGWVGMASSTIFRRCAQALLSTASGKASAKKPAIRYYATHSAKFVGIRQGSRALPVVHHYLNFAALWAPFLHAIQPVKGGDSREKV